MILKPRAGERKNHTRNETRTTLHTAQILKELPCLMDVHILAKWADVPVTTSRCTEGMEKISFIIHSAVFACSPQPVIMLSAFIMSHQLAQCVLPKLVTCRHSFFCFVLSKLQHCSRWHSFQSSYNFLPCCPSGFPSRVVTTSLPPPLSSLPTSHSHRCAFRYQFCAKLAFTGNTIMTAKREMTSFAVPNRATLHSASSSRNLKRT